MSSKGQKRKKGKYIQAAKGKRARFGGRKLDYGMKGFLITCNRYERETINEVDNLFNEYADAMYGPENVCLIVENCMSGVETFFHFLFFRMKKRLIYPTVTKRKKRILKRLWQLN